MEKVSIILPIYNAEDYLRESVNSLLKQTYKNIELILVDDGSIDKSFQICKEIQGLDNRVVIKSIENSGVSTARNIGISLATGKYLTFVDSDDWAEPNMIEYAVEKIEETNSDIVIWSYFKNYVDKEFKLSLIPGGNQVFTGEKDKELLYLRSIYQSYGDKEITETVSAGTVWCKIYNRDFIVRNKLQFNPILTRAQDTIFSIKAFNKANKISYYDEHLYHYRINNSSTCSGTRYIENPSKPFDALINEFENFILNENKDNKFQQALDARVIQVLMWHLKHKYFHDNYEGNILKKRKEVNKLINEKYFADSLKRVSYNLLPKKEKVMAKLFKKNFILTFYVIYMLNEKVRFNKNNRRYD